MADDFYMFLPSNSSMDVYPNNTTGHFIVKLPQEIRLTDGAWECSLREIHYPHSWNNVTSSGNNWVRYGGDLIGKMDPTTRTFVKHEVSKYVKEGFYESPDELAKEIRRLIKPETGNRPPVEFHFDSVGNRATVVIDKTMNGYLKMANQLKDMLGLSEYDNFREQKKNVGQKIRVFQRVHNLFVYMSVLSPRVVGDSLVPLLNIVPLQGSRGEMSYVEYARPTYAPVNTTTFSSLEIDIRDSAGRPIPFDGGVTTLLVHFRQRKQ